jgi:hypothetical protein
MGLVGGCALRGESLGLAVGGRSPHHVTQRGTDRQICRQSCKTDPLAITRNCPLQLGLGAGVRYLGSVDKGQSFECANALEKVHQMQSDALEERQDSHAGDLFEVAHISGWDCVALFDGCNSNLEAS